MKSSILRRKRKKRVGVPPGTLMQSADGSYPAALKTLIEYDKGSCEEHTLGGEVDYEAIKDGKRARWLNVDGIQDSNTLEQIGNAFGIHPLVLEDIQNPDQRPKIEDYDDYLFMSFKMLRWDGSARETTSEQVSLVLGKGYVISFQEQVGDVFDVVRERLRSGKGRVRKNGADYLACSLLDAAVDACFTVLERLEDELEEIEERVVYRSDLEAVPRIQSLRSQVVLFRRAAWPLRDNIQEIIKGEHEIIEEQTKPFFRDVHDHLLEVVDTIQVYRDTLSGLLSFHQSNLSKRLNATMRVLTIIATIFLPPTFIVGVYGMNFHYMPELSWKWGYPAVWGLMVLIAVGMIWLFKRKRWF